jgi:hypothetical protein
MRMFPIKMVKQELGGCTTQITSTKIKKTFSVQSAIIDRKKLLNSFKSTRLNTGLLMEFLDFPKEVGQFICF